MTWRGVHGWFVLALAAGCSKPVEKAELPIKETRPAPVVKERVSNRPANINGGVFIVEYHKIAKEEARWDRSIKRFREDLNRLYKMGFRPVTLTQYIDDKMDLAPGASPVIFTFDDSHISQFKFRPDGSVDPECAVGIWQEFAKLHPDFPVLATFYILPPVPFGQSADVPKKMAYLKQWGCEVGSHSMTHRQLSKLSEAEVKTELSGAQELVKAQGFPCDSIALPFGISPKNAKLLESFSVNGKSYGHRAALLVGANPAPAPNSTKRNLMRLPRIQSIEGDYGLTYWLDKVAAGDCEVYVAP